MRGRSVAHARSWWMRSARHASRRGMPTVVSWPMTPLRRSVGRLCVIALPGASAEPNVPARSLADRGRDIADLCRSGRRRARHRCLWSGAVGRICVGAGRGRWRFGAGHLPRGSARYAPNPPLVPPFWSAVYAPRAASASLIPGGRGVGRPLMRSELDSGAGICAGRGRIGADGRGGRRLHVRRRPWAELEASPGALLSR